MRSENLRLKNIFPVFNYFFIIYVLCAVIALLPGCTSEQVKYSDPIEMLHDNFWIDDNTLQIQVEYNSPEIAPYSMRRESSCGKAKEMIDARLSALYPSIKDMAYKVNIYKTMYHKKSDCRLVVHVSVPQLRNKLK